jgi:hypothetical protein
LIHNYNLSLPVNFIQYFCGKRTQKGKYETNSHIKLIGYFAILKAITTTGKLHNNLDQRKKLVTIFNCSRNQVTNILNSMEKAGLIKRNGAGSILLNSWQHVADLFEIKDSNKISFIYNPEENKRIDLLIYSLEIKINQLKQLNTLNLKLQNNPTVLECVINEIKANFKVNVSKLTIDQIQKYLLKLQILNFKTGTTQSKELQMFRASIDRKVTTLKTAYKCKSVLTIAYLKKQLKKFKIAKISHSKFISNVGARAYKIHRSYAHNFIKKTKQPIWYMPDTIQIL